MFTGLRGEILSILNAADEMTVATIRPDGYPQATTVNYVSDGFAIYFGCAAECQKVRNDRAPEPLPALGALRGAQAFRVRLRNGLSHTIEQPTSVPVAPGHATINVP
jgi:hypothetical protein